MKKYSVNIEDLLQDGFSHKFATYYLSLVEKEINNPYYDAEYVKWAHENGFLAENAYAYKLTPENMHLYLSDYEYYKAWPINNWTRLWVDDKMTLKQMLSTAECAQYMPSYYFYSYKNPNGTSQIYSLWDAPYKENTIDSFFRTLHEVRIFACKPCNGTASQGFFILEYKDSKYFVNGQEVVESGICMFVQEHPNYLFTEFLFPSSSLASIYPTIHTIRIVVANKDLKPQILGGYLRFSNNKSGDANYIVIDKNNPEALNVFVDVDFNKGTYGPGKLTYIDRAEIAYKHPDTQQALSGTLPDFDQLIDLIQKVCKKFSTIEYMGFDIGHTDNGYKIMEINTHPGIKYMQIFKPLLDNETTKSFYQDKCKK